MPPPNPTHPETGRPSWRVQERKFRRIVAAATAAATTVILTGCTGTGTDATTSLSPTAASASAESTAAAAGDLSTPEDLVGYLNDHREDTAIVILRDDETEPVVATSPDEPMPLASTRKVLVLLAAADAIATGQLDPAAAVPLADVERWYAPGTDGGAHDAAVTAFGPNWTVDTVLRAMIVHSDNAAADWVLDRVGGPDQVMELAERFGMADQQPVWSLLGEYLAWEREPAEWLAADAETRLDIATRLAQGQPGPVTITPPSVEQQRELALASSAGTARDWAELMQAIATQADADDPAAAYALDVLSWPMAIPENAAAFSLFATKGGSLPGVITEASTIQALDGERLTVVQFYRDLPTDVEAAMAETFVHQLLLAELALESDFLDEVVAELG